MHKKPLISRLSKIYKEQQYSYFVLDGTTGETIISGLTEIDARIHSMKNDDWSIGREDIVDTGVTIPVSSFNDAGVEITYANKDILTEEDFDEM
tara:strand:- start:143 stop:424 length:282 start_codon:yes stop_codon:yes gene_type:complete